MNFEFQLYKKNPAEAGFFHFLFWKAYGPQLRMFESLQMVTLLAASVRPVCVPSVGVQTADQIPERLRLSSRDFGVVPLTLTVMVAI